MGEDTLMLMPMENSNRFSTLLMELGSVLLTLACLLLQFMMVWHLPSALSHLLLQLLTQSYQLLLLILLRLLKLRLPILQLLKLPLLLLRERGVKQILLLLMGLPLLILLMPMGMLVSPMLVLAMVCPTMVEV